MENKKTTFLVIKNLNDVFYQIKNNKQFKIICGGTQLKLQNETYISLRNIEELKTIEKKERWIDYGPSVTLSQMLENGSSKLPKVLVEALESIGSECIRNIATLGGNLFAEGIKHTLWAPLYALNARLEFKSQNETKYVTMEKFSKIPEKFILTKIRVPLEEWEVQIFKRTGPVNLMSEQTASFAFLVNTEKDMISNIKIVFAGKVLFLNKDFENKVIGSRLPLNIGIIDELIEDANEIFKEQNKDIEYEEMIKMQFLNLLRYSFEQLM